MEIVGSGWAAQKARAILARGDRWICWYCHVDLTEETWSIDHVVPKAKGGSNDLSNCVLACLDCNHQKADGDPIEFIERVLSRKPGKRVPRRVKGRAIKEPGPRQPERTISEPLTQRLTIPPELRAPKRERMVPSAETLETRERIAAVRRSREFPGIAAVEPLAPWDEGHESFDWC